MSTCPVVENASTNRVGPRNDNHGTPEGVLSGSDPRKCECSDRCVFKNVAKVRDESGFDVSVVTAHRVRQNDNDGVVYKR